jgi:hypothetical protein
VAYRLSFNKTTLAGDRAFGADAFDGRFSVGKACGGSQLLGAVDFINIRVVGRSSSTRS